LFRFNAIFHYVADQVRIIQGFAGIGLKAWFPAMLPLEALQAPTQTMSLPGKGSASASSCGSQFAKGGGVMSRPSNKKAARAPYSTVAMVRIFVFLAMGCFLANRRAYAQNRNAGEIRGTITDSTGGRVPDATITITNISTGVSTRVVSGSTGVYDAPSVEPGKYEIAVTKFGFKKFVRSGIVLHVEAITVDALLQVGSVTQEVTVTAPVPLVQMETSDRGATFTETTINELPNVGRSWWDITGLLPGVNPGGESQDASGQGVGVNGAAGWEENWLTDGGVNTLPVSQNPALMVPLDAISEISFSTSNFSAEYGNGVAVFNVITKSGTNSFHGSLYEFAQNDKFEARNFFSPSVTPLRWNMYGGTIGGPIRRDKAFFFFSFQSNPSNYYSPTFYTFPTLAMKKGDFSDPNLPTVYDPASLVCANGVCTRTAFQGNIIPQNRFDPVAANIQNYFPQPNLPGLFNNYYFAGPNPSSSYAYNGKVDYNVSASNRLMGSLMYNPGSSFNSAPTCPMAISASSGCQNTTGEGSQAQITDTWTLSPALVNEARISFVRSYGVYSTPGEGQGYPEKIGLPNAPANIFPNITVDGAVPTSIGGGLFAKLGFNSFMYSDKLTFIKGKHILKFGGEYDKWQDNQGWATLDSGDYDFSGIFTSNPAEGFSGGLGYADFLVGLPDSWGVSMAPETGLRSWNVQAFAQDDYKVTPHLTLDLGVRYQLQTGWTEVHDRYGNFDPNLMNPGTGTLGAMCFAGQNSGGHACPRAQEKTVPDIFDPRIGFAWSPRSSWSIRGSYGIFTMMWGANSFTSGWAPGWSIQGSLTTTDMMTPVFQFSQGPPPGSIIYPSAAARTPDMLNGQGTTYNPYNTPAYYTQQWHFDLQHQLRGNIVLDAAYVGSRGIHLLFFRDMDQVPANLLGPGNTQLLRPYPQYYGIGADLYDGISNYHSFQLSARKEFSHGLSFIANYTVAKTLDAQTSPGWSGASDTWQIANNWRVNYAPALMDIPQLLNGSFVYELPVGSGKALLNHHGVLNGVLGGWQLSSTFQLHSGLPFTPTMGTANLSSSLAGAWYPNRVSSGVLADPSINLWFDTNAFVQPDPYTFGNSGRDILRGPSWKNMSLSLAKNFRIRPLGEGGRLQMRADAYDVFNHPNFGMPDASIGTDGIGVISSSNTNRNLQLGVMLSF